MQFVPSAPEVFDIAVQLLQGHWQDHMFISRSCGESAKHTALVGTCENVYGDPMHRLHIKTIPMKWTGRGRPLIKWAGIGTRAILYTPRGLQAFMNIRYTMRASDVDSVQQLVKMGYDLGMQHPCTTFYPSIGLHTTDFSDFFRGSGIKKNNMGGHPTGPYIVVRPKPDEDVMHRLEMVAEGIWVAQKAQVGVIVVWPNTGNSSILFTEGFVVKERLRTGASSSVSSTTNGQARRRTTPSIHRAWGS